MMRLSLKTPAAALPLDWSQDLDTHLRLSGVDSERTRIENVLIPAAVDFVEGITSRQLITATWYGYLDHFPDGRVITMPRAPLQSVTAITYVDGAGATQTLSASLYTVDAPAGPKCSRGRIILNYGGSWPSTLDDVNAVRIEFVAGYGADHTSIPGGLKAALLLHVAEQFERREDAITGTIIAQVPQGVLALALPFLSEG